METQEARDVFVHYDNMMKLLEEWVNCCYKPL